MAFKVVCISRTLAAGGEIIGQTVSQRLDYKYVDEEIIAEAARKAQTDVKTIAAAEHKQPFMQRIFEALAVAPGASVLSFASGVPMSAYYQPDMPPAPPVTDDYRALIRSTIHEIAERGHAVIVAHAASMALAGMNGVLRVLITAPPQTRADRISAADPTKSATAAAAEIATSDRERGEYFRLFYRIKEELPIHYDLVINTEALTPAHAVELILAAAQS